MQCNPSHSQACLIASLTVDIKGANPLTVQDPGAKHCHLPQTIEHTRSYALVWEKNTRDLISRDGIPCWRVPDERQGLNGHLKKKLNSPAILSLSHHCTGTVRAGFVCPWVRILQTQVGDPLQCLVHEKPRASCLPLIITNTVFAFRLRTRTSRRTQKNELGSGDVVWPSWTHSFFLSSVSSPGLTDPKGPPCWLWIQQG